MPSWGRQIFENNGLSIAKNEVPGYSAVHVIGYNPDVDSNESQTIWSTGGLYPWSVWDTPRVITAVSTSASDTGSVLVFGLNQDFEEVSEEISFSGLTSGTGTVTFSRVTRAIYLNGDGSNVGTITLQGDGTTIGTILPGFGQIVVGVYTIPAGKTGFLLCGDFTLPKNKDVQIQFFVREFGGNFRIAHVAEGFEKSYRYDFPVPIRISEKSDLEVRATRPETNNTRVTCAFDIILIDNNKLRR